MRNGCPHSTAPSANADTCSMCRGAKPRRLRPHNLSQVDLENPALKRLRVSVDEDQARRARQRKPKRVVARKPRPSAVAVAERTVRIVEMHASGMTIGAIADAYDVSIDTVYRALRRRQRGA